VERYIKIIFIIFLLFNTIIKAEDVSLPNIPEANQINELVVPLKPDCVIEDIVVTENDLNSCYKKHLFLLEAIALISDQDFANENKIIERKKILRIEISKDSDSVLDCYNKIIFFSKKNTDQKNQEYVEKRLSEISAVLIENK
jgi:hypothetical protein